MKIIVLGTRGFPNVQGGIEKHCEELYPRLAARGCDVTVISRSPYTGHVPYMFKGVNVLPMACPKHKFLEAFLHTFAGVLKARQLNPDLVHIHAIGPSLFVPFARMLGLKVVMTHHGPDYDRKKWNTIAKVVLRLGERLGVNCAHKVIVISRVIADSIMQSFGREGVLIPNGVVVAERTGEADVLKRYDLEAGKYILAVGRIVPEKGFSELGESFRQFTTAPQDRLDRWKLVIVGDADHEDEFTRSFKRASSTTPDMVLTGFQSGKSLQELYSHAGLFVLPSFHEGLPISLLEALSYGSSCLVSDIPANREVGLEDRRYFKPGDINMMSRKLIEFMDQPTTEEERALRIRDIEHKYNWARIAESTFNVYASVAGGTVPRYSVRAMPLAAREVSSAVN